MEKYKKTILFFITYTVILVFSFIYMEEVLNGLDRIFMILSPFLLGGVLAFLLNVLLDPMENKWLPKLFKKNWKKIEKRKRLLSLTLSLIIIFGFLFFLFSMVIPELKNAVLLFIQNIPEYTEKVNELLEKIGFSENSMADVTHFFNLMKDYGISFVKENRWTVVDGTFTFASNLIGIVTNFVLGTIFAIYLLLEKEKLAKQGKKIVQAYLKEEKESKIYSILSLAKRIGSHFIRGQFLEAFIIGFLCFVGMLVLRLPYALTISMLVGVTALIPVFGAFIGTIVGAFLLFIIEPFKAIVFVVFILILQQIEGNLIYPKVVGKSVGLPGIWVLVAVTIGASLGGVLGMLVSVPLCSILYSILATNVKLRLENKKEKVTISK